MVSLTPTIANEICNPPEPQPRATGISRDPNGTWNPGMQTAWSKALRISRLDSSSRRAKGTECGGPAISSTVEFMALTP